jgi:hypothetical protein
VSVGVAVGRPPVTDSPEMQPISTAHGTYLGIDFGYQYHFGYPGRFRTSIGAAYDYSRFYMPGASLEQAGGRGKVLFSGSEFLLSTGFGYYGLSGFGFRTDLQAGMGAIKNLTTDANDFSELNQSLWFFRPSLTVAVQYLF